MLIDSNIFLEYLLDQEKADKSYKFIHNLNEQKNAAYISDFNVDSIILSLGKYKVKKEIMQIFLNNLINSNSIIVYEITFEDRLLALEIMEKYQLDYEDALTLQSALSTNSREIVSFDKHFDGIDEIKRIEP